MSLPIVDVLIPVYNGERDIASSIASIQAQSLSDIRIVVVNDGSTDGTAAILAELAAADPRLHVITRANGGIVDALNEGLAICTAEFVARHDADDIAYPNRFADQVAFLRANPDCVAVDGQYYHIDEHGHQIELRADPAGYAAPDPVRVPSKEPYLMHPFATFRREAMQTVGGYRYAFHAEDTDLYWRLLGLGNLYHMGVVLGEYRIHGQSVMSVSPMNGRISAANSQLAAISHLRRQANRHDVKFAREQLPRYKAAQTLQAIIDIACEEVDPTEAQYLSKAIAAKLLELSLYRSYALDDDDYRTIARHLGLSGHGGGVADTPYLQDLRASAAYQLARKKRYACARMMKPPVQRITSIAMRQLRRWWSRDRESLAA